MKKKTKKNRLKRLCKSHYTLNENHKCCVLVALLSKHVEGSKYNIHTKTQKYSCFSTEKKRPISLLNTMVKAVKETIFYPILTSHVSEERSAILLEGDLTL
jgi:hypothetical protein